MPASPRSYGAQTLRIYRMRPEIGPPDLEEQSFRAEDVSWAAEWRHFRDAIARRRLDDALLGNLGSARYALERVEDAYRANGYDDVLAERA